jgi:hypothetical protein
VALDLIAGQRHRPPAGRLGNATIAEPVDDQLRDGLVQRFE